VAGEQNTPIVEMMPVETVQDRIAGHVHVRMENTAASIRDMMMKSERRKATRGKEDTERRGQRGRRGVDLRWDWGGEQIKEKVQEEEKGMNLSGLRAAMKFKRRLSLRRESVRGREREKMQPEMAMKKPSHLHVYIRTFRQKQDPVCMRECVS
jgi:hypothetical protein